MNITELVDLASARVGGKALAANDEFFAPKENLLKPGPAVFIADKFTSRGKWMDGWETRRRREPGYDWCVIRLGMRGVIRGVNVDTSHFTGNFPQKFSMEACDLSGPVSTVRLVDGRTKWTEIAPQAELKGGSDNVFILSDERPWTHVRLNIYPDGGVARLRVHGTAIPNWTAMKRKGRPLDLASVKNGGQVVASNDMFFGHRGNLILPGRPRGMFDGWETKRRRGPGHDWVIVRLGRPGTIRRMEVDTSFFKGNAPASCSMEGAQLPGDPPAEVLAGQGLPVVWENMLPDTKLKAHTRHFFQAEIAAHRAVTHVRFHIYPDGGVARLRLYGDPAGD